jgi:tripartite-type tricarboxylate transporter receptor subunit TctC
MMMTIRLLLGFALTALAFAPAANAQSDFAGRTITILVPFPPGGTSDVVTRVIAAKVADSLKATVVIDNRSGGGGVVAAIATKQAAPDGTTLFLANNGLFAVTPAISSDVRFDPVKDFAPITPLVLFPSVLIVPAASPAHTLKELVEYGRSKPSGLSFASQGIGSGGQIMGELLRLKTGLKMVHVPYRGAGPAAQDVAGGNIDMLFTSYISAAGQIQGGKVRVIAFTGQKRSSILPDVPTAAEQGFAGIEMDVWHGIVAPAGTPAPIVQHLNAEFVKAAQSPDVMKMVSAQAADILTSTPEEFARLIAKDIDRLGGAVRAAGIKAQ